MEILGGLYAVSDWIQILSLATGIIYMVMQVFQHKWMWYLGLCTAGAACIVTLVNFEDGVWAPLWAQVALNAYFVVMDLVGIRSWRKLGEKSGGELHVVKLPRIAVLTYGIALVALAPLMIWLLSLTNDPEPFADGLTFALSIVAQLMLTRSHLEQWFVWIAADLMAINVYAGTSNWWMVALYACYTINAFVGIYWWREKGKYI